MISSQPVHKSDGDGGNVDSAGARGAVVVESFTQPSRFDELIVGTQIPCTPGASQVMNVSKIIISDNNLCDHNCYKFVSSLFM